MLKNLNLKEEYSKSQEVIVDYLKSGLKKGKLFFKSKYIAKDLGMSSKEVGMLMSMLAEMRHELIIEKWSYTNCTIWRVEKIVPKILD